MLLSTPGFLFLFLPLVLAVYLALPRGLRPLFLFAASLLYYTWITDSFVAVLLVAILVNYVLGLRLAPDPQGTRATRRTARLAFVLVMTFDLGLLLAAHYSTYPPTSTSPGGFQFWPRAVHLGASFFAMALISYALDVRQGRVAPSRDPLRFGLYVALFPKIIAGPIVRFRDIAGQLLRPQVTRAGLAVGIERFILGLAKKVLIADALAPAAGDLLSTVPQNLTASAAWLGILCFSLQIYFDFSGYSDMAIGLARMLGFEFLENFNYPYVSRSIREFWQRWHISLSNWLRDYLYLPLAYAVSGRIRSERFLNVRAEMWAYAVATFATMLLCGLWHGLSWGCAVWGLWHGLFLTLETTRRGKALLKRCGGPARYVLTQWVVLTGWVFFRAGSLTQGVDLLRVMYSLGRSGASAGGLASAADYLDRPLVLALGLGLVFCFPLGPALRRWGVRRLQPLTGTHAWIPGLASLGYTVLLLSLLFVSAMSMAGGTYTPFVYQQF
jgi:alginate O-acetyltransferase complex protein AlgI